MFVVKSGSGGGLGDRSWLDRWLEEGAHGTGMAGGGGAWNRYGLGKGGRDQVWRQLEGILSKVRLRCSVD